MDGKPDPYAEWLGIQAKQRPLNNYQILGIRPLESDATLITQAADRQVLRLKAHLSGPHTHLAKRAMHEVESARACLLDPKSKATYDSLLQSKWADARRRAAAGQASPKTPAAQAPAPSPTASAPSVAPTTYPTRSEAGPNYGAHRPGILVRAELRAQTKEPSGFQPMHAVVTIAVAVLMFGIVMWVLHRPGEEDVSTEALVAVADDLPEEPSSELPPPPPEAAEENEPAPAAEPETMVAEPAAPPEPVEPPASPSQETEAPKPTVPPDPLAKLAKAIDLPDPTQENLAQEVPLGRLTLKEEDVCQLTLAEPETDKPGQFQLAPVEGEKHTWQLCRNAQAGSAGGDEALGRFSFRDDELRFQWLQAAVGVSVEDLRNCLLKVELNEKSRGVRLRTPQILPVITVDLDKSLFRIPLDDLKLPDAKLLKMELVDYEGFPAGMSVEGDKATSRDRVRLVLRPGDPAVEIELRLTTLGGKKLFTLRPFVTDGGDSSPFTNDRVDQLQKSVPKALADVQASLATVAKQADELRRQQRDVSAMKASAARTIAAQHLEGATQSLNSRQRTLNRRLATLQERMTTIPELVKIRDALHDRARLVIRIFFTVGEEEVDLLRTEGPAT